MTPSQLICPWEAPQFLFYSTDPGIPNLLYYAYIPIIIAALILCSFVFFSNRHLLASKILLLIGLLFTAQTLNTIFEWTSNNPYAQMFSWQINGIFELPISLLLVFFVYVFLFPQKKSFIIELTLQILFLPVVILLPTAMNVVAFYVTTTDCGGVQGPLWAYIYALEILSIVAVAIIAACAYWMSRNNANEKIKILLIGFSSVLFLGTFNISNIFGELTKIYQINLIGPIGMLCFIGILAFMIVKYQTFNIKTFATQALVVGIAVLIGARLFYSTTTSGTILSAVTLIGFLISGVFLIQSVKREIEQRERIEKLAKDLESSNEQLSEFMSLATHEIRNPATFIKGFTAGALEGDLGELAPAVKDGMQKIFIRANDIIHLGNQYMDKSKLELNQLKYEFVPLDLGKLAGDLVREFEPAATQQGITISANIDKSQSYEVQADSGKIKEVVGNLIDNAIKYTKQGTVTVSLTKGEDIVTVKIVDTGNGIPAEIIPQLFKKFSRADAEKANLLGTGLGLYLAKIFIDAHHGKIWVESAGKDKGSTFFVELPIAQEVSVTA